MGMHTALIAYTHGPFGMYLLANVGTSKQEADVEVLWACALLLAYTD
jgi:hypothetical protein